MGTKQIKSRNGFTQGEYCNTVEKLLESVLRAHAVIVINEA